MPGARIAIVGAAPSAGDAPYADPSWSVWALPWRNRTRGIARYFEMHERAQWSPEEKGDAYLSLLRSITVPLYMTEVQPDIPASVAYPMSMVLDAVPRPYFASSIAYMVALAITHGPAEIGLWGVDLTAADEYRDQRPNLEWLLGLAEGRGIRITMPPGCPLLSCPLYGLS